MKQASASQIPSYIPGRCNMARLGQPAGSQGDAKQAPRGYICHFACDLPTHGKTRMCCCCVLLDLSWLCDCRRDPRLDGLMDGNGVADPDFLSSSDPNKRQRTGEADAANPNCTIYIPNPSLIGAQVPSCPSLITAGSSLAKSIMTETSCDCKIATKAV